MMGNWTMDGGMGIWMLFNMIFWILLTIGIAFLVIWIVRRSGGAEVSNSGESSLEILKKRYARGEITKEEFEEKKRDIL